MSTFPPTYVVAEAKRFNHMRPTADKMSLLALHHLIDTLAFHLVSEGLLDDPSRISAELVTTVVADPNRGQARAILEALEEVTEFERQYSTARDHLVQLLMKTRTDRDSIAAAAGFKSPSRLYQIVAEGDARRLHDERQGQGLKPLNTARLDHYIEQMREGPFLDPAAEQRRQRPAKADTPIEKRQNPPTGREV